MGLQALDRIYFAKVLASTPPRGGGTQDAVEFHLQSMEMTWSWGAQPGSAVCNYVWEATPDQVTLASGVVVGALLELRVGTSAAGGGDEQVSHRFFGLCKGDNDVAGSNGKVRTLEFVDLREFLAWDHVFGAFNMAETIMVSQAGVTVRKRRYWHILPANHTLNIKTYTDTPLTALQILDYIFTAPTVETGWFRIYHPDQAVFPVYELDFMAGERLDAAVVRVSEKHGLVFTLAGSYILRWARKGYLLAGESFPIDGAGNYQFPSASDDNRDGWALSGNATRVTVMGERNVYQVMNVGMGPDWVEAWSQFWDVAEFVDYVVNHFEYEPGKLYKDWPASHTDDPENIVGWQLGAARAKTLTVREFGAQAGSQFYDFRRFAGRSRMDMPCWLYIQTLLFRAFRPPGVIHINGNELPIESMELVDQMLAQVTHDPGTGAMTADVTAPLEGNGYAIIKGYQVGSDGFRTLNPSRFNPSQWVSAQDVWQATPFQIDDSGFGSKFIIFDTPVIRSADLMQLADGYAMFKANPTITIPPVLASLTFLIERFKYVYGSGGRDAVINESGLHGEYLYGGSGSTVELKYADGQGATEKADLIARTHLQSQWVYKRGSATRWLRPGDAGTYLNGMYDRVTVNFSPREISESMDFTTEAQRNFFLPERDYDRTVASRSLFPGQAELKKTVQQERLFAAGLQANPKFLRTMTEAFRTQVGGGPDTVDTVLVTGGTTADFFNAGTPLWRAGVVEGTGTQIGLTNTLAVMPAATTDAHKVFVGATVRENEMATKAMPVSRFGDIYARVMGPASVNDTVGRVNGMDYLAKVTGDGAVGRVLQDVPTGTVKVAHVMVGAGGGGGRARNVWQ